MSKEIHNRRNFVKASSLTMASISILPNNVIAGLGHKAPSDKLNIVGIGIGGRGFGNLKELESENIVALCDVDWNYSQRVFEYFPKAKRYKDWRVIITHEMDWVRACKESPEKRVPTLSDFEEAGPFNEMVVIGAVAVRLQSLNKELEWDGENMKFTNIVDSETIKTVIKDGFEIHEGHPTFNKEWTNPVPARQFAEELVKHSYRAPWSLPEMPL